MRLDHLAPSGIGGEVTVRAEVTAVDGRRVSLAVEATDAGGAVVGRGTVERVVVDAERFLDRLDRRDRHDKLDRRDPRPASGSARLQRVAERQPLAVLGERPLAEVAVTAPSGRAARPTGTLRCSTRPVISNPRDSRAVTVSPSPWFHEIARLLTNSVSVST